MLLGDLIARFKEESIAEETILGFADLTLLADLRAHAEASGLDLGSFAAAAACRYAAEASHEEWITLMGAMGRARDPGASYLERALAYAMRENCSTEVTTAETAGEQDAGSEPEAAM